MAQIKPGKHCVPKNVFLDILDFRAHDHGSSENGKQQENQ